ncbi:MAG: hypothetical protein ACR2HN_06000 [Tepidiformaceae bacterium]
MQDRMKRSALRLVLACAVAAVTGCASSPPSSPSTSTSTASGSKAVIAASACPRTAGGRKAKGAAIALGDGPAYPVLGMPVAPPAALGVVNLDDDVRRGSLYLHKTLWATSPGARGTITVRVTALSSRATAGFFNGADPDTATALRAAVQPELRLPRGPGRWAYTVTSTVLPGPGCYAFDLRGPHVNQRIVFRTILRSRHRGVAKRAIRRTTNASPRRFTSTELETALLTNPNDEARSAACATATVEDRARHTFGRTRAQLFVCTIRLMRAPARAEAFDVQVLHHGCFIAERIRRGQAAYGCIRP